MIDALNELAQLLTTAGVPASIDPAKVQAPGAWIEADTLKPITLDGRHELNVNIHLIVQDHGTTASLEQLEQLLTIALAIVDPRSPVQLDGYVATRDGKLPAFTIPTTLYP